MVDDKFETWWNSYGWEHFGDLDCEAEDEVYIISRAAFKAGFLEGAKVERVLQKLSTIEEH